MISAQRWRTVSVHGPRRHFGRKSRPVGAVPRRWVGVDAPQHAGHPADLDGAAARVLDAVPHLASRSNGSVGKRTPFPFALVRNSAMPATRMFMNAGAGSAGAWSRRVTDEHRLVHLPGENEVIILRARHHYE
ncbi:type II toxin-antitoxin system YoeB family toxin [Streptomyces sp. JNUCC 63]